MQTVVLNPRSRDQAKRLIDAAPNGYVMTVKEPKRTDDQNAKMWAMLSDISRAKPIINGVQRVHTPEVWKAIIMNACGHQVQFVPGIDGEVFPIGFRSSQLNKSQMSGLIEYLYWFGAEYGVTWTNEDIAA